MFFWDEKNFMPQKIAQPPTLLKKRVVLHLALELSFKTFCLNTHNKKTMALCFLYWSQSLSSTKLHGVVLKSHQKLQNVYFLLSINSFNEKKLLQVITLKKNWTFLLITPLILLQWKHSLKMDSQSHFSLGSSVILISSSGELSLSSSLSHFKPGSLNFIFGKLRFKF